MNTNRSEPFKLSVEESFELQKTFLNIDAINDLDQLKELFKESLKLSKLRERYFRTLIESSKCF